MRLVTQLPRTSRFRESQLDDEELALVIAARPETGKPTPPAMSTFTPEVELLTFIGEALQAIQGTLVQLGGGKPQRVKPLPRPVTAVDRARETRRHERLSSLVSEAEAAMRRYQSKSQEPQWIPVESET